MKWLHPIVGVRLFEYDPPHHFMFSDKPLWTLFVNLKIQKSWINLNILNNIGHMVKGDDQ